ncbi:MAG: heme-dependent peroxidase [Firmicutes bacterium]|nr:heme-dependent peroxidase [Bacillota bacterium]
MTAPETLDGWFALHDIRTVDWRAWQALDPSERAALAGEAASLLAGWQAVNGTGRGSSGLFRIIGHKGDLLFLHFRPSVGELAELERAFETTRFAAFTERRTSFLSVVELSRHGAPPLPEGVDPAENPVLARRLRPDIPDKSHVCFYPMNKRRGETVNWFTLPTEERRELMRGHGQVGHRYAGRVVQIITGAMGLDDWEWGVTLFTDDPLDFKKLVYEMRFDPASALYAEFGPFFVGMRLEPAGLVEYLSAERSAT